MRSRASSAHRTLHERRRHRRWPSRSLTPRVKTSRWPSAENFGASPNSRMRLAGPPSGATDHRPARKRLKTIRSLSGDQTRRLTGTSPNVIWMGSPSARFLTQTCGMPSTSLRNAMKLPSGEKLAPQCSPENVEIKRRSVACSESGWLTPDPPLPPPRPRRAIRSPLRQSGDVRLQPRQPGRGAQTEAPRSASCHD